MMPGKMVFGMQQILNSQKCSFPELRDVRRQDAARIIQRTWKLYQIRKQRVQQRAIVKSHCPCTLCYFRNLTKTHRLFVLNRNATLIQSTWRGYNTRKVQMKNREIRLAYRRLLVANSRATEELKLGSRLENALMKLHRNRGNHLDAELVTIEIVTKMSPECCLKAAQKSVIPIMMNILNESNRSEAHKPRVAHAISIIVNLAKYDKCVKYFSDGESIAAMCIKMMKIHKRSDSILLKCATLLAILSLNRNVKEIITKDTMNKFTITSILKNNSATNDDRKIENSHTKTPRRNDVVRFYPYWCLRKGCPMHFLTKNQAIAFLSTLFCC
ncbi:abnormal spindle-like microcephaly-associated protein homolog [Brevipalpus obovatus]|uniref:abnormal spindle-like microcephaly-associated protein homolog n=1 Tax=Brevipalpus obovatus TaxID=246614 RepID=UPI003D9E83EE